MTDEERQALAAKAWPLHPRVIFELGHAWSSAYCQDAEWGLLEIRSSDKNVDTRPAFDAALRALAGETLIPASKIRELADDLEKRGWLQSAAASQVRDLLMFASAEEKTG